MGFALGSGEHASQQDFYLLLGLCTRALCGRPNEPTIIACLEALRRVVTNAPLLLSDTALFVEVCNVLHHTCRSFGRQAQRAVVDVLRATVEGDSHIQDSDEPLKPGTSCVFAVLQVCTALLLREMPQLNPALYSTPVSALPEESIELLSGNLQVLAKLPSLCQPHNAVRVLPAVLILLVGVIKDTETALTPVALKALRTVLTTSVCSGTDYEGAWTEAVLAAYKSVLDALDRDDGPNLKSPLLALAVFLLSQPQCAAHPDLRQQATQTLARLVASAERPEVQQKALQVIQSTLQLPEAVLAPYVFELVPRAMEILTQATRQRPATDAALAVILDAMKLLETLIARADDSTQTKLLAVYIPLLVAYLNDNPASPVDRKLHDRALDVLKKERI